eukprot:TRINITY_DN609_c0_g1_i2.p1 TRINITY_DN609_c0_g1~~TRINITY_DN609_c0_g1_i2.p1  ORF type:complete len:255 (+),score=43.45 TRINITY_DN609_c0_g1_i2:34-798(+)
MSVSNGEEIEYSQRTEDSAPSSKWSVESKVRLAAIGVGNRMTTILTGLFSLHPEIFTFVAYSDESPKALENCQYRLGKYWSGVPQYQSYRKMLEEHAEGIDWVFIGSKNFQHKEHALASFASKCNVFCEKPIGISIEACKQMRDAAAAQDKLFITGFVLRFAPLYQQVKGMLNANFTGKIVNIEANEHLHPSHGAYIMRNWRRHKDQAGPHILEKCCHDIDVLNWLIDSVPVKVAAFGGKSSLPHDTCVHVGYV